MSFSYFYHGKFFLREINFTQKVCLLLLKKILFFPFSFPDIHVRKVAIDWLSSVSSDDFVDFLPQLLEALKNETWTVNHLSKMMLEQSLSSPKVSHALFWLIAQSLPGQTPHGIDIFVSQIF